MNSAVLFLAQFGDADSTVIVLEVLPRVKGAGAEVIFQTAALYGDARALAMLQKIKKEDKYLEMTKDPRAKQAFEYAESEIQRRIHIAESR